MYQVMWTTGIWLGTRRKSAHASIAQIALSMCSSTYSSTFTPLFLYFWVVVVFWVSLTFSFYFFDIFSSLKSTKEVTTENMNLNKWKTWPMEFSEDVLEIDKDLMTMKRGSCDHFLTKIKISNPDSTGMDGSKKKFWSILIYGTSKSEFVCEN